MVILNSDLKFYTNFNFKNLDQKKVNFLIFNIFCGKITKKGKRLLALNFVYQIFLNLRTLIFNNNLTDLEINKKDGAIGFFLAIKLLIPMVKIVKRKKSGTIYELPTPLLRPQNAITIAVKNLIDSALKRNDKTTVLKLTHEIIDTLKKDSLSYYSKLDKYFIGLKNKPFLKYLNIKQYRFRYTNYKAALFKKSQSNLSNLIPNIEQYPIKDYQTNQLDYNLDFEESEIDEKNYDLINEPNKPIHLIDNKIDYSLFDNFKKLKKKLTKIKKINNNKDSIQKNKKFIKKIKKK